MEYKYKRWQLFGKRLNVPKNILNDVYNCTLSFYDYIEYQLDDKIPTSCINEADRKILEKFGIDKCKKLDWELINKTKNAYNINFRDILMSIDSQTEDINYALYELVKDQIKPSNYSSKMSKIYSDRLFEITEIENSENNLSLLKMAFNDAKVNLKDIIINWELFKNKDLSSCLLNDENNKNNITDSSLKEFMNNYGTLVPLINIDLYTFINNISSLSSEKEKRNYLKQFTDDILNNSYRKYGNYKEPIKKLTDEQYKKIFKYSSIEEYLKTFSNEYIATPIIEELKTLPRDYVFNMSIPISELLNYNVLSFIGTYGLKNIVDFDNECGHFFTKNNCEMLKLMNDMYLNGSELENDPNKTILTKKDYDENGNYINRPYTKDEFYEAMRRMIKYGHNSGYNSPNYGVITGEFRVRNAELFISEEAPEELQEMFYTNSIDPQLLLEHPEYIQFLNGKDLSLCLKRRFVYVEDINELDKYQNIYKFLSNKTDFNGVMNFITEYNGILNIMLPKVSVNDDIDQIKNKIYENFRENITKGSTYPTYIPKDLSEKYPSMFLDKNAPKELKEAFYSRTITSEFILSNPAYRNYLNGVDLECLFKYMPVKIMPKNSSDNIIISGPLKHRIKYHKINFVNAVKQTFGESYALDVMLIYGKYIEKVYEKNDLKNFLYNSEFTPDAFLDELDKTILQNIINGNMKYDENMPSHFKNNNPTFFLADDVPQEIKEKFYNRELTLKDFNDNQELFNIFENTNIVCGFSEDMSWIIPLFKDSENFKVGNYNRMKVILAYSKIEDYALQQEFKEYVMKFGNNIDAEKIKNVSEVLARLSLSNSSEIFTFREELATQILKTNNPLESLSKIENIFIKNNIPTVGKIYSCFEILHPDFQGFNFENSIISPVLKKSSTMSKKVIVFSDLIKSSFGSNNRSVNAYLKNIEFGSKLYESIKSGQIQFDSLGEKEIRELNTFCSHLSTLYNNTMKAKKNNETFKSTGSLLTDIFELSKKLSPDGTLDYNLADIVIRKFCGFTGIDTLEQAKKYIEKKVKTADSRNRNASNSDMVLNRGDFIKGIGDITYLRNILQNGSVSKEYLGSDSSSDFTPLDTDISMITSVNATISQKMDETAASSYGPIWFVLKNDDRFITTRTSSETLEPVRDMSKMEVFYTGVLGKGHYGIRTGFASSEINYIVMNKYDPKVGLEIAMNGFYIPVADKNGKIIFTPKDYDELREKMSGLSYYDENNYNFSRNLVTEETINLVNQIEKSNYETKLKKEKLNDIFKKSLEELGLKLKTTIDGDLTEGYVELIDTGSTGRGTNKPQDGDFDFMMRIDKNILLNSLKLDKLKKSILKNLGKENSIEVTGSGDFRLKSVKIGDDTNVDVDITFVEKTDKVLYSTDMSLIDRLSTIKKIDKEKYKYVVANILHAKQVLKKAEAYKPNRGENPQGGLGGVGIENWILQNGGSFIDAAKSFIEKADGKDFFEFKENYQIWDFGDNHLAEIRGQYRHDNFVANNMSEAGYKKMVKALKKYLKDKENNQILTSAIKR